MFSRPNSVGWPIATVTSLIEVGIPDEILDRGNGFGHEVVGSEGAEIAASTSRESLKGRAIGDSRAISDGDYSVGVLGENRSRVRVVRETEKTLFEGESRNSYVEVEVT